MQCDGLKSKILDEFVEADPVAAQMALVGQLIRVYRPA